MPRLSIIKAKEPVPLIDFGLRRHGMTLLLASLTGRATPPAREIDTLCELFERPNTLVDAIARRSDADSATIAFIGPIERRIALLAKGEGGELITFGDYGPERLPAGVAACIRQIERIRPQHFRFAGREVFDYVARPTIYLAALYHPEVFPLPRLSLAISDLVRAARTVGVARVFARDMQLGATIDEIADEIVACQPDIIGVSATFGQHDVLEQLLDTIAARGWPDDSMLVFGGSLCVLNRAVLLEKFPDAVVATGPGERAVADLVRLCRRELALDQVAGIAYRDANGEIRATTSVTPRDTHDMLPELDLLDATFARRGVTQLESSRGCSYACSFCPREHKGVWAGDDPRALAAVIPDIRRIVDRHPRIAPKVFLVDEEFFGYRPDGESEQRVLDVAELLASAGLSFETSSRADQVFRRNRDRDWHVERLAIWRRLAAAGLERCLFGIESGVDSILARFNKKTSAKQNAAAVRILSLLDVPPRYTYITFDPLMTREELIATYAFQARTDLVLPHDPALSEGEIFDIAISDPLAEGRSNGTPFYRSISYMLVSMECLSGAPYTAQARSAGLLDAFNPNMGRYDARYLDPEIGLFSDCAQRWIDRNFKLDYLFKSIEKYARGDDRSRIRLMRDVIKDFAFDLLGTMIGLWDKPVPGRDERPGSPQPQLGFGALDYDRKRALLREMMDRHFEEMTRSMRDRFAQVRPALPDDEQDRIMLELEIWAAQDSWDQINELKEREVGSRKPQSPAGSQGSTVRTGQTVRQRSALA